MRAEHAALQPAADKSRCEDPLSDRVKGRGRVPRPGLSRAGDTPVVGKVSARFLPGHRAHSRQLRPGRAAQ